METKDKHKKVSKNKLPEIITMPPIRNNDKSQPK